MTHTYTADQLKKAAHAYANLPALTEAEEEHDPNSNGFHHPYIYIQLQDQPPKRVLGILMIDEECAVLIIVDSTVQPPLSIDGDDFEVISISHKDPFFDSFCHDLIDCVQKHRGKSAWV